MPSTIIKLSSFDPNWSLLRQSPGSAGIWGEHRFVVDSDVEECDYWVVFGGITRRDRTRCPKENVIFITTEPASVTRYTRGFLRQFHKVLTFQRQLRHPNLTFGQACLPWHVGRKQRNNRNLKFTFDYDELKSISVDKPKLLSVVSSAQVQTLGHRRRLSFVKHLKDAFGDNIDVFGRGIREVEDKWDAIAPYKYHIAIENSCCPDYWTEKLSDTYLGHAYPLYSGCPNIHDYFARDALTTIDILDPPKAIQTIKNCIQTALFERSQEAIRRARELVLDKYNLFPTLAAMCPEPAASDRKSLVELRPEREYWSLWQEARFRVLGPLRQKLRKKVAVRA